MKLFAWMFGIAFVALGLIINGTVLSALWDWFMLPIGLLPISTGHAIGLAAVGSLLTHQYNPRLIKLYSEMTDSEKVQSAKHLLSSVFLRPGLVYVVGWVAHFYV